MFERRKFSFCSFSFPIWKSVRIVELWWKSSLRFVAINTTKFFSWKTKRTIFSRRAKVVFRCSTIDQFVFVFSRSLSVDLIAVEADLNAMKQNIQVRLIFFFFSIFFSFLFRREENSTNLRENRPNGRTEEKSVRRTRTAISINDGKFR